MNVNLSPGTRLGLYEIIGPLGAGGMGEVYRARDTKLNRDVAIKVLPELFALDPDRLARFAARGADARGAQPSQHRRDLRHRGAGRRALVMELVEGEDLVGDHRARADAARRRAADREADRRGARGRARARHRPPRSQARQHQGPRRRHGEGARLRPRQGDGPGRRFESPTWRNSPTLTPTRPRWACILGTAAYMAPEQARGKPSTSARTSGPSASCCTRCSPAARRSPATPITRHHRGGRHARS